MKNWKTFLLGLLAAVWVAVQPVIANGDFDLQRDWKELSLAVIIALFGYFTKDKGVTGIGEDAKRASDLDSPPKQQ